MQLVMSCNESRWIFSLSRLKNRWIKLPVGRASTVRGPFRRMILLRLTNIRRLVSCSVLLTLRAISITACFRKWRTCATLRRNVLCAIGLSVLNGLLTSKIRGLVVSVWVIFICRRRLLESRRGQCLCKLGLSFSSVTNLLT